MHNQFADTTTENINQFSWKIVHFFYKWNILKGMREKYSVIGFLCGILLYMVTGCRTLACIVN